MALHRLLTCALAAGLFCLGGCQDSSTTAGTPADLAKLAGYGGKAPNSTETFRFVVMSDRTAFMMPGVWAKAVGEVNLLKPDFVMCVGDLTEGYSPDASKYPGWYKAFDAENDALEAPLFFCPGNHDTFEPEARKAWMARRAVDGRTYYSFNYRGCHFIILDSTPWVYDKYPDVQAAQWDWLAKDLAAAKSAKRTFFFVHHPLFDSPKVWSRIRGMIDPATTTFFSGHTHTQLFHEVDGVAYHVLPGTATSQKVLDPNRGKFQGFAVVTVDGGKPRVAVLPLDQVRPSDFVNVKDLGNIQKAADFISLSPVVREGDAATVRIENRSEVEASYKLTWRGEEDWFKGGKVADTTVKIPAGGSMTWTHTLRQVPGDRPIPTLDVAYEVSGKYRPLTGTRTLDLPLVRQMTAVPLSGVKVDGRLDEWKDVPATSDSRSATQPAPPHMTAQLAYDDKNLYVAMRLVDDKIVTEGKEAWERDGVEVFIDPRADADRNGAFAGECRQLLLNVPPEGTAVKVTTNPDDPKLLKGVQTAIVRREGGYDVELAIPLEMIGKGFKPQPGKVLRMDFYQDDKSNAEGPMDVRTVSGRPESSRITLNYVIVNFK